MTKHSHEVFNGNYNSKLGDNFSLQKTKDFAEAVSNNCQTIVIENASSVIENASSSNHSRDKNFDVSRFYAPGKSPGRASLANFARKNSGYWRSSQAKVSSKLIEPRSQEMQRATNKTIQPRAKHSETQSLATVSAEHSSSSDRLKSAISRYRYRAQLNPDSAVMQTNLGRLYHKNQQFQEAISCYHKAIAIDGDYLPAHRYLAQIVK
ncbi:tetratricopeptide repeat protein [Xenococcus sp. PCC 7305]|uniref:tetratricopeptide repeat protein n=1 Tax=Xenococcus sp. PCC 7305 TaxID=102125 RepID=UPI0002AC0CE3|nr:tetratricopeptide repeat protein [Xenococcus sp. PCC 7305]ELS00399.1 tetratricopeptide repeat protein [Xenococcus sp. PCC 7305]